MNLFLFLEMEHGMHVRSDDENGEDSVIYAGLSSYFVSTLRIPHLCRKHPFWAAAPKGAMSYRIGGFCPVRPYVRPSPSS